VLDIEATLVKLSLNWDQSEPRGLRRATGAALLNPVRQPMQIAGEGSKAQTRRIWRDFDC